MGAFSATGVEESSFVDALFAKAIFSAIADDGAGAADALRIPPDPTLDLRAPGTALALALAASNMALAAEVAFPEPGAAVGAADVGLATSAWSSLGWVSTTLAETGVEESILLTSFPDSTEAAGVFCTGAAGSVVGAVVDSVVEAGEVGEAVTAENVVSTLGPSLASLSPDLPLT
jgi:hypothetical protein